MLIRKRTVPEKRVGRGEFQVRASTEANGVKGHGPASAYAPMVALVVEPVSSDDYTGEAPQCATCSAAYGKDSGLFDQRPAHASWRGAPKAV